MLLCLRAEQRVDHSLVEAAQVDGATDFQTFWRIMWPQIMPTTLYRPHHHHHQSRSQCFRTDRSVGPPAGRTIRR
ncbi:MAG: ABC transporter permease subunit [Christensenellales bacterium]